MPNDFRWLAPIALGLTFLLPAGAVEVDPNLPAYEPRLYAVPKDAAYVKSDGTIFMAGASAMKVALKNLNDLFIKTHPGTRFSTTLAGSSIGPAALLYNRTPFGVVDRILLPEEIVPFQMMYTRDPIAIRVGRGSYSKLDLTPAMAICVNPANPIEKLTTEQVASIFTVGSGEGDITNWGQAGLDGAWARRSIDVIGVRQRTGEAVFMKTVKFGDHPFVAGYEGMASADIAPRLAEDPYAIALVDLSHLPAGAKVVAVAEKEGGYYSKASYEDVVAGRYPYTSYIYFYLNQDPAQPTDPFVKEYLRMVLSKEGQQALVDQPNGFLPLTAKDAAEELAKLK